MIPAMKDPALWLPVTALACRADAGHRGSLGSLLVDHAGRDWLSASIGGMSSPQYGAAHKARRKQAIARLVPGTPCPVSGAPMHPTPSVAAAVGRPAAFARLHLDHGVPVAMGGANGATRLLHATVCHRRPAQPGVHRTARSARR